MINLTSEQQRAYDKYIAARNSVQIGTYGKLSKTPWAPLSDVKSVVDIAGLNHPLYEANDGWLEYTQAFSNWLAVEPEFRKDERMSMIRGDYGTADSWRDKQINVKEI